LSLEFNEVRIIDLKGNARTSGDRRRKEGGNVFDDQIKVGVAVWFAVKRKGLEGFRVYYEAARDYAEADEKLTFLTSTPLASRSLTPLRPDARHKWIDQSDNDFESLIPLISKDAKAGVAGSEAICAFYTNGVKTQRDEWVYDRDGATLRTKITSLIRSYESVRSRSNDTEAVPIKWDRELDRYRERGVILRFDPKTIALSINAGFTATAT
jgi:predicted helicase